MSGIFQKMAEKKAALLLFIPLLFLYGASYFQRTALPGTIFNELALDLNMNGVQVAAIGASFIYAYSLTQYFWGMMVDKYGGARVVQYGGLLFLAGIFIVPFCENHLLLYTSRALAGAGASCLFLSLIRESDRHFDRKNYTILMGVTYFFGYGGGMLGTLPFERLSSAYSWRNVLIGMAVITLIAYIAFVFFSRKSGKSKISQTPFSIKPFIHVVSNPYTWVVIFCSTVTFCTYFIIQTVFGKKFLQDFTGMGSAPAAIVICLLTVCCVTTIVATSIIIRLCGNRRKPPLVIAAGLCMVNSFVMALGIYYRFPGWVFAINYFLYAVSAGVPGVYSMVIQEVNAKSIITQATSFSNTFGYLAVAVFSPLIGLLLEKVGGFRNPEGVMIYSQKAYLTLFIIVCIITCCSFIVSFFIPETKGHYFHQKLKEEE